MAPGIPKLENIAIKLMNRKGIPKNRKAPKSINERNFMVTNSAATFALSFGQALIHQVLKLTVARLMIFTHIVACGLNQLGASGGILTTLNIFTGPNGMGWRRSRKSEKENGEKFFHGLVW
jgi:hypothetical protein